MIKIKHIVVLISVVFLILGNISVIPVLFNCTEKELTIYLHSNVLNILSFLSFILLSIFLVSGIICFIVINWEKSINLKKLIKK